MIFVILLQTGDFSHIVVNSRLLAIQFSVIFLITDQPLWTFVPWIFQECWTLDFRNEQQSDVQDVIVLLCSAFAA